MKAWIMIFSGLLLVGCSALQPVEVVRVDGLTDLRINRDGMSGDLVLVLNNPNGVTIGAEQVEVEVFINSQRVGVVQLPFAQSIPKGPEQRLQLTVQAETKALLHVLQEHWIQFLTGKEVEVGVQGEVRGSALGIPVTIPVSSKENMKIQLQ